MKHGTPVRFKTSLSGTIGRGHKLSDEMAGTFLSFADSDEEYCRILVDESRKIVVARRYHVHFSDTFYGESDGCGYCKLEEKSRKAGICRRGERLSFMRCGTTNENDE